MRDEQLEIDVPARRAIALKMRSGAPVEASGGAGAVVGDRRVYRWKSSHALDSAIDPKVLRPGDEERPADVRLSSFRTWDEFAGWFAALASVDPDTTVRAKASALIAGVTDDAGKIAAIYRYVATEIRYVSLSFGLGRFAAHPPADVLAHQYGDCKDKAVLLQALLRAVGVHSVPVLLNTGRSIGDDFASPLEFDHMIALVPRGVDLASGTWMDATPEIAPVGMLIAPLRNRRALAIAGGAHATVVRTPADPPFASVEQIDLDGTLNAIRCLTAKVAYTLRGDAEIVLRTIVRAAPRSALKDVVTALAAENGLDGEVSEVITGDPAETAQPFQITFQLRQRGYLDWAAAQSEIAGRPTMKFGFSKEEDRKGLERIFLGSPKKVHLHASVELPLGYEADIPQAVKELKAGPGLFRNVQSRGTPPCPRAPTGTGHTGNPARRLRRFLVSCRNRTGRLRATLQSARPHNRHSAGAGRRHAGRALRRGVRRLQGGTVRSGRRLMEKDHGTRAQDGFSLGFARARVQPTR